MITNTAVRKHKPRVVNICLLLVLLLSSLNASNYVTVATIGTRVPVIDQKEDMQEVVDKVDEFDLELMDDYFDRSRRFREKNLKGVQLK